MVQFDPEPNYNERLAERVVAYLQTRDWRMFPFTKDFDADQRRAFARSLQEGLSELTNSGSARKTSATGFVMSDRRLQEVVHEWGAAQGGWPAGENPKARVTAIGANPEGR